MREKIETGDPAAVVLSVAERRSAGLCQSRVPAFDPASFSEPGPEGRAPLLAESTDLRPARRLSREVVGRDRLGDFINGRGGGRRTVVARRQWTFRSIFFFLASGFWLLGGRPP